MGQKVAELVEIPLGEVPAALLHHVVAHLLRVVHLKHHVLVVLVAAEPGALAGARPGGDGDALEVLDVVNGHGENLVAVRARVHSRQHRAELLEVELGLEAPVLLHLLVRHARVRALVVGGLEGEEGVGGTVEGLGRRARGRRGRARELGTCGNSARRGGSLGEGLGIARRGHGRPVAWRVCVRRVLWLFAARLSQLYGQPFCPLSTLDLQS
mmetsp:Transcript_26823/g.67708  ORF Transcript_26823/g.67708 Transcript_26823/m.67708 type:complete len:212 (-) Transcript_26823:55-690(-)